MYRIATSKSTLDPYCHRREIDQLKLAAIVHRKKLLELGERHQIRLHYGATMSSVEILSLLYLRWLQVDPQNPTWPERDRFVLSKGHAAPALYVALCMSGFFPESEFDKRRMSLKHNGLNGVRVHGPACRLPEPAQRRPRRDLR